MSDPAGLHLARLAKFLANHVPGAPRLEGASLIEGGRSNITYEIHTDSLPLILRRPPLGDVAQSANDVSREYRVMAGLQGTAVPVPGTVAFCDDVRVIGAPFSLVEKVDGTVLRSPDDVAALFAAEATDLVENLVTTLVAVHRVDYTAAGLERLGRPAGFVGRQVDRWLAQWEHVATRDLPDLARLHERLRRSIPPEGPGTIVHGDYRLDNVLVAPDDPGRVVAVLDWEMATLGDPLTDLGLMLVYWDPTCAPVLPHGHPLATTESFPGPGEVAARYAEVSGASLEHLSFYQSLGYFKLAVIAEGIHGRYRQGFTVGDGFESVGDAVPALLARGLEVCHR